MSGELVPQNKRREFIYMGPFKGRKKTHLIQSSNFIFHAKLKTTLSLNQSKNQEIYVIPYHQALRILSPTEQAQLNDLSQKIDFVRKEEMLTAVAAYKAFLILLQEDRRFNRVVYPIPWKYGPIPVFLIGKVQNIPVCTTPIPLKEKFRITSKQYARSKFQIMEVISTHFIECMEDYFAEITDELRAAFFNQDKRYILQTVRRIQRILDESIYPKFQLFVYKANESNEETHSKNLFNDKYCHHVTIYKSAAAVINAVLAILKYVSGADVSLGMYTDEAISCINNISEDDNEIVKNELRAYVNLLVSPLRSDLISPLGSSSLSENQWLGDLKLACLFLSHVLQNLENSGRKKVFIFVSHHMDVYASEEFYRQIAEQAKVNSKELTDKSAEIVVWTGYGRQYHILYSILTKIWLSDVQILYLPNSLDTRDGRKKKLNNRKDWVVNELFYGACIEKPLHFVIAEDSKEGSEKIRNIFLSQIKNYDWRSLPSPINDEDKVKIGTGLYQRITDHLCQRIYTTHNPSRSTLCEQDAQGLNKGVFAPAIKNLFESKLWTLRMGFEREQWILLQAVYEASLKKGRGLKNADVSIEEIKKHLNGRLRYKGSPVDNRWILFTLDQCLVKKSFRFADSKFNLVEKVSIARRSMYNFSLAKLNGIFTSKFNGIIGCDELESIMQKVVQKPIGIQYATTQ